MGRRKIFFVLVRIVLLLLPAILVRTYSSFLNPNHQTHPPTMQGLYESCPPIDGLSCLKHLKQMSAAGFTLVVNYDQLYGTQKQELAYAEQAHMLGMKVIWAMNDPVFWDGTDLTSYYKDLAASCNCSDNNGFIHYVVNLVKHLPATWGYYVGDEVKQSNHADMKAFADSIKEIDPSHPRLFISGEDSSTMGSNLKPFVDTADVIGADVYPVGTSEPITTIGDISRSVQSIATQNNKPSALVLQAFSWSQYPHESWVCFPFPSCAPFPTKETMQEMHDLALDNSHPAFILWYSYFDIFRSDNPASHWTDLVAAADTRSRR